MILSFSIIYYDCLLTAVVKFIMHTLVMPIMSSYLDANYCDKSPDAVLPKSALHEGGASLHYLDVGGHWVKQHPVFLLPWRKWRSSKHGKMRGWFWRYWDCYTFYICMGS